jgi:hypothetical protein
MSLIREIINQEAKRLPGKFNAPHWKTPPPPRKKQCCETENLRRTKKVEKRCCVPGGKSAQRLRGIEKFLV